MPPVLDASSPPRLDLAAGAASATTASFTPPANSVLVAKILIDAGAAPAPTLSMSNSGTALTWISGGQSVTGGEVGSAIFVALQPNSVALTVTFSTSNSDNKSFKLDVYTGCDPTGFLGDTTSGIISANTLVIPGLVATRTDSLGIYAGAQDESTSVNGTSPDSNFEALLISGQVAGGFGRKALGDVGVEVTYTMDADGTGLCSWHYVGVELLAIPPALPLRFRNRRKPHYRR